VRRRAPGEPAFTAEPVDDLDGDLNGDQDGDDAGPFDNEDSCSVDEEDNDDGGSEEDERFPGRVAKNSRRSTIAPPSRNSSSGRKRASRAITTDSELPYGSTVKTQRILMEPGMDQYAYAQERAFSHAHIEHSRSSSGAGTATLSMPESNGSVSHPGPFLYPPDHSVAHADASSRSAYAQPYLSSELPPPPTTLEDAARFHHWLTSRLGALTTGFPGGYSQHREHVDEDNSGTAMTTNAYDASLGHSCHSHGHALRSAPPESAAHEAAEVLGPLGELSAASEAVAAASRILDSGGLPFATHPIEPTISCDGGIGGGTPQPQQQDALIESSRGDFIDARGQPKEFMQSPVHGDSSSQEGTRALLGRTAPSSTLCGDEVNDDGQAASVLSKIAHMPHHPNEQPPDYPGSQWPTRLKPRLISEDQREDNSPSSGNTSPNTVAPFHGPSFPSNSNGNSPCEKNDTVHTAEPPERLDEMPRYKNRPLGKTGHRFILKHEFVTKSGAFFSGYSLQV